MEESNIVVYSNFWTRLGALIMDNVILGIVLYYIIPDFIIPELKKLTPAADIEISESLAIVLRLLPIFGMPILGILYRSLFESSSMQATPGKAIVGIKVVDIAFQRISFPKAFFRNFVKIFSSLIFYIGFLVALRDNKCVTWHDSAAKTFVINN